MENIQSCPEGMIIFLKQFKYRLQSHRLAMPLMSSKRQDTRDSMQLSSSSLWSPHAAKTVAVHTATADWLHKPQKAAYCEVRAGPGLLCTQPRPRARGLRCLKRCRAFSKTFSYQHRLIFMMDHLFSMWEFASFRESSGQETHLINKCMYIFFMNSISIYGQLKVWIDIV